MDHGSIIFSFMVHMGFYHRKFCHVPQFGATMKPIEPQGHLSKISECYDISKYNGLKISRY